VIQPWSHGGSNNVNQEGAVKSISGHPVTSIHLIPQPNGKVSSGIFESSTGSNKNISNFSSLVTPLEMYVSDTNSIAAGTIRVPFLKKNRTEQNLKYWEAQPILHKRRLRRETKMNSCTKTVTDEEHEQSEQHQQQQKEQEQVASMSEQIKKLQNQLKGKDSEVERWKTVNNKLMLRLQAKS